jgi:cellulose biosynthesis protein BcsQ
VEPKEKGMHVGAILADEQPDGWAADLAVPAGWAAPAGLQIVPSSQQLANRERAAIGEDAVEGRLRASLEGWDRDLVIIDVPNRQGGALVTNALTAADAIIVPLTLDEDGLDALDRTRENVARFRRSPWNPGVTIAGIVATVVPKGIPSKEVKRVWHELDEDPDVVLGSVPDLVIVKESRAARDWWGNYDSKKARRIAEAYDTILNRALATKSLATDSLAS